MWAQLVKTRVKPGRETEVEDLQRQLEGRNNPAWRRTMLFHNPDDPREHYILVLFESEEAARHHEQHPEQDALTMRLRDCYAEPPEFVDLNLVSETSPQTGG